MWTAEVLTQTRSVLTFMLRAQAILQTDKTKAAENNTY